MGDFYGFHVSRYTMDPMGLVVLYHPPLHRGEHCHMVRALEPQNADMYMYIYIYLLIYLFIYLFLFLFIYFLFIYFFIYLSIYAYILVIFKEFLQQQLQMLHTNRAFSSILEPGPGELCFLQIVQAAIWKNLGFDIRQSIGSAWLLYIYLIYHKNQPSM